MKNCIYISIVAVLWQHFVEKSNAFSDYESTHFIPVDLWNADDYSDYGYYQNQQQDQVLNGGQSHQQQQMSIQYQYPTEPPYVSGVGVAWHNNYEPIQHDASNQYSNQQQQQHIGLYYHSDQYPHYSGMQQHQYSQIDMNGYGVHGNQYQYQYQDNTQQLQDQYRNLYNTPAPTYSDGVQGSISGYQAPTHIGTHNSYFTDGHSNQYEDSRRSQHRSDSQATVQHNRADQYTVQTSEHAILTTQPPIQTKYYNGGQFSDGGTSQHLQSRMDNQDTVQPQQYSGQFSEQPEVLTTLYKQSNQIRCPPDVRGVFPYPFSNTQYIKCIDGRLLIKSCRRGQMFSLSRKLCDLQDHLLSFDTAVPVHLSSEDYKKSINMETSTNGTFLKCPNHWNGTFIYPFLDTRYVQCENGVTELKTCLSGAIYSIRESNCLSVDKIDANDHVKGIDKGHLETFSTDRSFGVICGPQSGGRYAHPSNWRKFVVCHHGVITVKTCPHRKIFDITLKRCIKTT